MNTYEQIIFNELAQQRPVLLSEVGCLMVKTRSAQVSGRRSVTAPHNVVVFTPVAPANTRNVVDIRASNGTDSHSAWDQYNQWLAGSRKDGKLVIEGVGTLENDIFTPTQELDMAINPNSPGAVAVKPRSKGWIWILIVIAVIAALIVVGMNYCDKLCTGKSTAPKTVVAPEPAVPEPAVAPAPETANPSASSASSASSQAGLGFPVDGMHYVVAGVFDIPANADRYDAYIKRSFIGLTPEKFMYPGVRPGRTMVTMFSSANRREALEMRRDLAESFDLYELWVFPQEK